ncbi:UEV domain-containing protein [Trichoderma breve]|uniref:UEV domain-containing protein n=1 Tax=Trichoderma breve TaxID=2034170 RepID=A0A9W9BKX3_9HYPO|nr:UEV domain-containing protein [Trichoderma breve]KAJ4861521.1 UEV domain-containing protein [Trichoderma breve]
MPVQQHVLNWLYSVLTSEYHDVNRTYNDVATVLARYPTLAPRTDVHTFPNGASALLVHLTGTIPVLFRGTTYRFPVSIWVPHAYPREAPLVYVTPTETMMVRPGQHVDPQGQVYHPYLAGWVDFWDKSSLNDFLSVLSDVFAKEPPVISRQQPRATTQSPPPAQEPPPITPHPPERPPASTSSPAQPYPNQAESRPPPPPPKPHQETPRQEAPRQEAPHQDVRSPPPIPPHPHLSSPTPPSSGYSNAQGPVPPQSPPHGHPQPLPQFQPLGATPGYKGQSSTQSQLPPQAQWQPPQQQQAWDRYPPPQHQQQQQPPQPQPQPPYQKSPPPPNLLDDGLSLEIKPQTIEAPPIPPNPEKDALLRQLAQTLASIRQRSRQQNESSMAGLEAQQGAMLSAMSAIQAEMGQLTQFTSIITSNTNILHDALRKADAVIEGSRNHVVPDIDELLVAPTVVSNQLYRVVAEERALGDAIFMLGRAVERGRISPAAFAKMTRSLAREWYLKKALARKIAQGMGLMV